MVPAVIFCLWYGGAPWAVLNGLCVIGLVLELAWLSRRVPTGQSPRRFLTLGTIYVMIAAAALVWLRERPRFGWDNVLFLLLVVWATDSGAYLIGRRLGGRKLWPRISPGKTWSGAIGGTICGIIAGLILAALAARAPVAGAVPAALVISVVAQLGDLMESAFKRWLSVKDSGRIIPGHGGLFDRLDGILASAPFAALFALAVQGGMPLWR
jgi:phosphatidate cytidylyltransferase